MSSEWWQSFFDADYLAVWADVNSPERSEGEADALLDVLELGPGARLLDAPCGYGRLSAALAARGLEVVGVDLSEFLLEHAEATRADAGDGASLRYLRQDLRRPLGLGEFDAAINVFSSLGYGSDADDEAILATLRAALRPGGKLFIDTMHRDVVVARISRGDRPAHRRADGTLIVEKPILDPIAGRIDTTWTWSGPAGKGEKSASIRVYTATELVRMCERAGLRLVRAVRGISTEPFTGQGEDMGGRLGLLLERPA
jgi:SAM-dependent methyltransferase